MTFTTGDAVSLTANPAANNSFTSWDIDNGAIIGNITPYTGLQMTANRSVVAIFDVNPALVRIDGSATPYYSIASALVVPTAAATIRLQSASDFIENINMTNPITILLKGGYSDIDFTNQSGYSTISGSLKIKAGTLKVDHLKIMPCDGSLSCMDDPCAVNPCISAPPTACYNYGSLATYSTPGVCSQQQPPPYFSCSYPPVIVSCGSNVCSGGLCVPAGCTDGNKNGNETDVDCGGSCAKCGNGKMCLIGGDCTSGKCIDNICQQ